MSEHTAFALAMFGFAGFEAFLGKTKRVRANSTLELLANVCHAVVRFLSGSQQNKGERVMAIEEEKIKISGPVRRLLKFGETILTHLVEGKDASTLLADLQKGLPLLPELSSIDDDYLADDDAVENAVMLGGRDLTESLLAAFKAKKDSSGK